MHLVESVKVKKGGVTIGNAGDYWNLDGMTIVRIDGQFHSVTGIVMTSRERYVNVVKTASSLNLDAARKELK